MSIKNRLQKLERPESKDDFHKKQVEELLSSLPESELLRIIEDAKRMMLKKRGSYEL